MPKRPTTKQTKADTKAPSTSRKSTGKAKQAKPAKTAKAKPAIEQYPTMPCFMCGCRIPEYRWYCDPCAAEHDPYYIRHGKHPSPPPEEYYGRGGFKASLEKLEAVVTKAVKANTKG